MTTLTYSNVAPRGICPAGPVDGCTIPQKAGQVRHRKAKGSADGRKRAASCGATFPTGAPLLDCAPHCGGCGDPEQMS